MPTNTQVDIKNLIFYDLHHSSEVPRFQSFAIFLSFYYWITSNINSLRGRNIKKLPLTWKSPIPIEYFKRRYVGVQSINIYAGRYDYDIVLFYEDARLRARQGKFNISAIFLVRTVSPASVIEFNIRCAKVKGSLLLPYCSEK